jgi:hypothetical protein
VSSDSKKHLNHLEGKGSDTGSHKVHKILNDACGHIDQTGRGYYDITPEEGKTMASF